MTPSSKTYYSYSSLIAIFIATLVCIHESQAAPLTPRRKRTTMTQQVAIHFCRDSPCRRDEIFSFTIPNPNSSCISMGFANDQISYVGMLSGNGRCQITLYSDEGCRGAKLTISNVENDLSNSFNDRASSFKVVCS